MTASQKSAIDVHKHKHMDRTPNIQKAAAPLDLVTDFFSCEKLADKDSLLPKRDSCQLTTCQVGSSAKSQTGFPVTMSAFPNIPRHTQTYLAHPRYLYASAASSCLIRLNTA